MSDESSPTEIPGRRRRWVVALVVVAVAGAGVGAAALFGAFDTRPPGDSAQPGRSSTATATAPTSGATSPTAAAPQTETTTASDLAPFAPSAEKVFSNGTVRLGLRANKQLDLIGWSTVDNYGDGHIVFTEEGLVGQNGTQFALLDSGSDTSFATCRDQTAWTAAITWPQVRRGSFACLCTFLGRRGIIRIDEIPDLNGTDPATVLTGNIWETAVDR